jgi:dihydropteroate synthase
MIYKTLDIDPIMALNGTTALHMYALMQGAQILRVHDVRPAWETIRLFQSVRQG